MGDDNFSYNHYLSKMNYPASDAWAYESAPLGPVETNVVTQTNGFQALANKGKYQKAYMIEKLQTIADMWSTNTKMKERKFIHRRPLLL